MSAIRNNGAAGQAIGIMGLAAQFADTTELSPTPLDPALASALSGNDLVAARKALARLGRDDRVRAFNTPIGNSKLLPVLDAARRGAPHMVALFEGMGAALNVPTARGLSPLHEALFNLKLDTARTLLGTPRLREALVDTQRVKLEDIHAVVDTIPPGAGEDELNEATLRITGGSVNLLATTDRLGIYHAHVYDLKDSPINLTPQGWHPEAALEARIRTLIGMAAASVPGSALHTALIKETATTVEALHLERRIYTGTNIGDPTLARDTVAHEVDGILRQLDTAIANNNPERRPFLIPIGTKLHQMYLELEPCYVGPNEVPHILMHFDNRGCGSENHSLAEDGWIYPIRTIIPASPEAEGTPSLKSHLRTLLTDMLVERAQGTVESVYHAIHRWMTAMTVELGVDAIEDPSVREAAWAPQAAGTCTIANLQPSTARRLGEHADAFFDFELADVNRRLKESVARAKLEAAAPARGRRLEQP